MKETKIYLAGLMGTGKSTVGRGLAESLGWRFTDTDLEVEREAGLSVPEIFARLGEPRFRELEAQVLRAVAERSGPEVVAMGGGAIRLAETRRRLVSTGRTVWLTCPAADVVSRIGEASVGRPLLTGLTREQRILKLEELAKERAPLYEEVAEIAVDTGGRPAGAIASAIAGWAVGAQRFAVELKDRSYEVVVEAGGLGRIGWRMREAGFGANACALVIDATLPDVHKRRATAALEEAGFHPEPASLPPGEAAKRLPQVEALLEQWASAGLDRSTPIVALGGGALTDAAGFAASIFLRGVPWVAVPTTLLGMVDAAIGGKTAVNLERGKNLSGTFHQPRLVMSDPEVLSTLPRRELRSGLGEVLKYALIGPREVFDLVDREVEELLGPHDASKLGQVVALCAAVKAGVVSRDEREVRGERKILNLGHTFGHAVEAASRFSIAHGDAVVLGMRAALFLSHRRGLLEAGEYERLRAFLDRTRVPPLDAAVADDAILAALRRDKKFVLGRCLFVLVRARGRLTVDVEVAPEEFPAAIAAMRGGGLTGSASFGAAAAAVCGASEAGPSPPGEGPDAEARARAAGAKRQPPAS